jgi:DNA gyrase/topoisomerase IV subunit A
LRNRLHITEGLLLALTRIDDIINLLKKSKDQSQARQTLTSDSFGLSAEQVSACSFQITNIPVVAIAPNQLTILTMTTEIIVDLAVL